MDDSSLRPLGVIRMGARQRLHDAALDWSFPEEEEGDGGDEEGGGGGEEGGTDGLV